MKKILGIMLLFLILIYGCKEVDEVRPSAGTINIINAAINVAAVKANTTGRTISFKNTNEQIVYGTNKLYNAPAGLTNLSVVSSSDTSKVLFKGSFNIKSAIYSMYISGIGSTIDTMFKEETNFPFIVTDVIRPPASDSVVNIRFVNLSPNSPALSIKLKGMSVNEVTSLSYKGISPWRKYPAKQIGTSYIFEVRSDSLGAVPLTSFTVAINDGNWFKNIALIIKGVYGTTSGSDAFGVFAVNYY